MSIIRRFPYSALRDTAPTPDAIQLDRQLVERCLARVGGAWEELYRRCHHPLLGAIRNLIRTDGNTELVDEIAARVWYSLTKGDFELLARFDVERGCRLSTFLGGIARKELAAYLRSERRRRVREAAVGQSNSVAHDLLPKSEAELDEFLAVLTTHERDFCRRFLLSCDADHFPSTVSAANFRQLKHRISRKLQRFMGDAG